MNSITQYGILIFLAANAAAQPVSYSRQIAPILAMNCNLCHGANPDSAEGGLSTRTLMDLNKGGNLGPVIVAGDPDRSPLFQFVSGARGEAHRMPLGGAPLSAGEVDLIRRWILEGAKADSDETRKYHLLLSTVGFEANGVRIFCRVPSPGYIEVEVTDSRGRILYMDGGAVNAGRGVAAIGAPEEWITWSLRRAPDWPRQVRARLTIAHTTVEPVNTVLTTSDPELPSGEADIEVVSAETEKLVVRHRESVEHTRRWQTGLSPGLYRADVHYRQTRREASILFRIDLR